MSITKVRLHELTISTEDMKSDFEAELAAITVRVKHLEDLVGTSGTDNSKLEQRLGTERERYELLQLAVSGCEQVFAVLQAYSDLMQKR